MNKRILITGGAGFIGTKLAERLVQIGHDVTVLDSLTPQIHGDVPAYRPPEGVRFLRADVRVLPEISELLDTQDAVFHLAAETGTGQSMYKIAQYVDVNEMGTASLLEALSKATRRKRRLVLASSRSIYGEGAYVDSAFPAKIIHPNSRSAEQLQRGDWNFVGANGKELTPVPTAEDLPAKPGSIYAATKKSQELLIGAAAEALDFTPAVLRFQNVYGEGQSLRNPYTGIISIFFNRIRQNLPINIFEDGLESRDFIHVSDVVTALVLALEEENQPETALNVGSGRQTTVLEVAQTLCRLAKLTPELRVSGDYRVGDIRHCFADVSAIKSAFGFVPSVGLEEGLSRFVDWASTQPAYEDKSAIATAELLARGLAKS